MVNFCKKGSQYKKNAEIYLNTTKKIIAYLKRNTYLCSVNHKH